MGRPLNHRRGGRPKPSGSCRGCWPQRGIVSGFRQRDPLRPDAILPQFGRPAWLTCAWWGDTGSVTRTLYALGRWCAERGVLVLVIWLALLGGVRFADRTLPPPALDPFVLAGTDSASAQTLLNRAFPGAASEPVPLVVADEVDLGSGRGAETLDGSRRGGRGGPRRERGPRAGRQRGPAGRRRAGSDPAADPGGTGRRGRRRRQRDPGHGDRRSPGGLPHRARRPRRLPGRPDLADRHPDLGGHRTPARA